MTMPNYMVCYYF